MYIQLFGFNLSESIRCSRTLKRDSLNSTRSAHRSIYALALPAIGFSVGTFQRLESSHATFCPFGRVRKVYATKWAANRRTLLRRHLHRSHTAAVSHRTVWACVCVFTGAVQADLSPIWSSAGAPLIFVSWWQRSSADALLRRSFCLGGRAARAMCTLVRLQMHPS